MSLHARFLKFFLWLCQGALIKARDPLRVARLGGRVTDLLAWSNSMAPGSDWSPCELAGVKGECIHNRRTDARPGSVMLFLHGGGFSFGTPAHYRHFLSRLAQAAHLQQVHVPDYTLVPQKPFPAGLQDVIAVWKALCEVHEPAQLVLGGDSAGGNLSLALCLACKQQGLPLPQRVYLSSPWLDVSLAQSDTRPEISDAFLGRNERRARQWIKTLFADPYVGQHDPRDPLISPALGDLQGLPPLYAQVAQDELFMADSLLLIERTRALGQPCELDVWQAMFHDFPIFAPRLKEANAAVSAAGSWLETGQVQRPSYGLERIRTLKSTLNSQTQSASEA